ncbi:hypothetical protein B0T10DRAFT_519851 [Thelonectria olida]|uniref:Uncharacterized protein n=1 Tax=Thelonectria olida TaxID=1576542 RepID=A0A9P9AKT8_9HYPO|nr:hypothetical protein B0T10DRAFT_519851 [Thelonectria olida]
MNACDAVNDWSSDGENGLTSIMTQILKPNPLDTQQPIDAASCDPPARNYRSCVPYADWILGESYIEQPPNCIHTALEWKFTFNNRGFAKQTEEELVVALSDFWDEELSLKIEEIAKTLSKPCKADSTTVVMSGNGRSETDITKTFKELQINWPIAEKQLHAWSHLLHIGKWLKINVSFKYVESGKTGRSAGRATGAQLADREVRLNAELATLDGPVYQVMKCPGPPCDRGPYCWQDSVSKKHYKLLGHHLRSLVRFV